MSFEKIFTHGNLVDINVSMWTAVRKLQPEDLGLPADKISGAFSLGHKKLVPAEVMREFDHLDYLARRAVEKYSFPFVFGAARFVPKKLMVTLANELDMLIQEYNTLADKFMLDYTKHKISMRKEFVKAATEAYVRAKAFCGFDKDKEEFINVFLERVETFYPPVEDIRAKFQMSYVVYQAALPDLSQATYADIAEEGDKIRLMQDAYQRTLNKKVELFVDGIVSEQRKRAEEVLVRFAEMLQPNRVVNEASLSAVRNMIAEYERMDIMDDTAFKTLLGEFKQRLIDNFSAKEIRNNSTLRKALVDELQILIRSASDSTVIQALAKSYREKIQL
jgi:hypothetical protein